MGKKKRGGKRKEKRNPVGETSRPDSLSPGPDPLLPKAWPAPGSGCGSGSAVDVDYSKIEFVMLGVAFWPDAIKYNGLWLQRNEYYRVYVDNTGEFAVKPLCDSQIAISHHNPCIMLHRSGSRIYVISNWLESKSKLIPDYLTVKGASIHFHKGISWVDLNDKQPLKKWHSVPSPQLYDHPLAFSVLDEEIHCIVPPYVERPKHRIPGVHVHSIPKHISRLEVGVYGKMIPEPSKNRILVHISDELNISHVYSWQPSTDTWGLITTEMDCKTWEKGSPILVDGVLYFYLYDKLPPYFSAFDLGSKKWLKVDWSTRFHPPEEACVPTRVMFYLGNGLVCLPTSRRLYPDPNSLDIWGARVRFNIFSFRRTTNAVDEPVIIFTYLFTKSLEVENLLCPEDFLTPF